MAFAAIGFLLGAAIGAAAVWFVLCDICHDGDFDYFVKKPKHGPDE